MKPVPPLPPPNALSPVPPLPPPVMNEVVDDNAFNVLNDLVVFNEDNTLHEHNLHPYQTQIINHITNNAEAMVYAFLGAGKTVCTLTAHQQLRKTGASRTMLVVAPLTVCNLTWEHEINKWSHLESVRIGYMTGSIKNKTAVLFGDYDIYLTNYESLTWLSTELLTYFINQNYALPFDMIVFDEISKMKRHESKRFKAFTQMLPYFNRRVGLTASPASNGLQNVWGQIYCLDLGKRLGMSFSQFRSKYFHNEGGKFGKWLPYDEGETRSMIVKAISDMTITIQAEGNIVLPKLTEHIIEVTMTPKQMREYLELEREFYLRLDSGEEIDIVSEQAIAVKLLQYANGILYNYPDEFNPDLREEVFIHDKKFKEFDRIYEETGDEPLFVVYQFRSQYNYLKKKYPDAETLVGASEDEMRDIRDRFNAGLIKMLIVHPASAGYGLNLQAKCRIIVNLGVGYNREQYEQTLGRIYRQGQKMPVEIYTILTHGTREQAVLKSLHEKGDCQQALKDALEEYRVEIGL